MLHIASTQHRGYKQTDQQDAYFDGIRCVQTANAPIFKHEVVDMPYSFAVADGVSVSPFPSLASITVVKLFSEMVQHSTFNARLFRIIQDKLCQQLAKNNAFGASTTLVAAQITSGQISVLNTGDSRAYYWNALGERRQLSFDHTIINHLIERGEANPNVEYADIYRGLEHCLIADFEEFEFSVHQTNQKFEVGDSLLLCTDGVHDVLGEQRLQALFNLNNSVGDQVEVWKNAILKLRPMDNFSMIFVRKFKNG